MKLLNINKIVNICPKYCIFVSKVILYKYKKEDKNEKEKFNKFNKIP